MVDFVAVIQKAVDGLSDNTPEMREKVYEKARAAIGRQLDNINPPVSSSVRQKQMERLEEAIDEIEDRNAEALPEIDDDVFADILADEQAGEQGEEAFADHYEDREAEPMREPEIDDYAEPQMDVDDHLPVDGPEMDVEPEINRGGFGDVSVDGSINGQPRGLGGQNAARYAEPARSRRGGVILIIIIVLIIVIGGFAGVWAYRDKISSMVFTPSSDNTSLTTNTNSAAEEPVANTEPAKVDQPSGDALSQGQPNSTKFTQRLLSDGSEIDVGPAEGTQGATTAEGKSVAALDTSQPAAPATADTPVANQPQSLQDTTAAPVVGQKMFLYEERLGQQAPTAEQGTVVWSIVRESPGDNQPPEPAIQAQIDVPAKGISAIMTIKRNGDQSLPASHLIEIVFVLADAFDGSGIDAVQNFAMKPTEQETGDSLIAVPAKITDSFFMIALNDYSEAVELNLRLLQERNWIDLPVSYGNGRRALLTMEKGTTGAEVFDQVIRAWQARTADTSSAQ